MRKKDITCAIWHFPKGGKIAASVWFVTSWRMSQQGRKTSAGDQSSFMAGLRLSEWRTNRFHAYPPGTGTLNCNSLSQGREVVNFSVMKNQNICDATVSSDIVLK